MVIETVAEVATLWIVVTLITVTAFRKRDGSSAIAVQPLVSAKEYGDIEACLLYTSDAADD